MRSLSDKGVDYLTALKKRAARDYAADKISKEKLDKIVTLVDELLIVIKEDEAA